MNVLFIVFRVYSMNDLTQQNEINHTNFIKTMNKKKRKKKMTHTKKEISLRYDDTRKHRKTSLILIKSIK